MPKTKLYLFGAPRLEYQNQTLPIDTRKALALLAYLLIEGKPQSRDTLATLLWPESNQTSARGALRRTLSTLRSALPEDVVDFGREVIALQPDRGLWSDVTTFRTRLEDCRTHGHPEDKVCPNCLIPLQQAAELYTDDFMAGFSLRDSATFDDWQFLESDALRRELAGVLECLVTLHQMQGEFPLALNYARRWLTLDSLNEAAHRALITLYAQNNQRSAALRQYRECVRALGEELGVHPLAETTQLYEAVKENRLDSPEITELKIDQPDKHGDSQTLAPNVMDTDTLPLVGRDTEWAELTRIYNGLRQNGVFAALIGEAGVGKTRLAQDFITHLKKRGAVTLSARCYAGENNLAYSSLIDLLRQGIRQAAGKPWWQGLHPRWLNEAALLIPELPTIIPDFPSLQPNNGPGAQSRFYEGFCQILTALVSGPLPGLIFIDNVELADESTLELLAYLVRRLQGRPVFLLVSWQTESVSATVLLEQILNDAIQQGYGSRLLLKSLQPHQALDLIEQFNESHQSFSSTFKQQLVESSQGLPFFLVEYLQATLRGEISSDEAADEWPIPTGLQGMLQARLANLRNPTLQILQAAAVIGHTFKSDLLQITSGRTEEEIIQSIEELLERKIIQEVPVNATPIPSVAAYDFKQEQIRALILAEISLIRLRLLHRRSAEALVELNRFSTQRVQNGQIAHHYQQAGLTEQAAEYYFQAGQAERAVYANADALAHFQAALALDHLQKAEVLIEIGDLQTLDGDYPRAIQQYEAAAAFSTPNLLPAIEQKLSRIYLRRGNWEQAISHFEAALYDLNALPSERRKAFEAEICADWSLACHRAGDNTKANALADKALSLAQQSDDPLALAQAHNLLGVLSRANQQSERALSHLKESLTFANKLEDPAARIAALNNLALAQADLDEPAQAIETFQIALAECITLGDRHLEAALRNNLADVLRANQQEEKAMKQLKMAVTIFAEIGKKVEDLEPEIWKLAEW